MNLLFFVYLFFFGFQQVGIPVPVPETIRIADQNFQKVEFQSDIITLFQDSRGLIWLGNRNGFVIYDGVEIFEYTEDFTDSSASRFRGQEVLKFAEDKFGRVWISTHSGGLNIFEKGTITHLNLETTNWAPPNVYGKDIVIQDSIAWFSTNQSLSRIRITEDISEISGIDFLSDWETHGIIHSFIPNEKGGLTGIGRGVFDIKYSDSQGIEVESIIESEDFFNRIIEDKNGNVLISQNQFLHIVGENRIKKTITIDVPDTDEHAMIKNLFIDNVGDLWVSAEQGFLRITYDSLYQVINSDFYESTPVENIIQDHSGNMWITQLDRSTLILNASYKMFDVIKYPESYNQKKAFLYLDDGYGNLWIAGELGIIIYNLDTKEFITVDEEPTLIDETVFSLLKDTQGNIWAGTSSYVVRYNPVTYEVKKWANRDMDPSYFSSWMEWYGAHNFSLDNFGNIWLLIQQTLTRIDPLTEEFTFHVKGGNSIDKILIDDEGKMWIWGNDRAIRVFDVTENGIIWNNDTYLDDTIDSEVSRIMDDGFGRIWIAWSAGIYILDKKTKTLIHKLDTSNLLRYSTIEGFVQDQNGIIWARQSKYGSVGIDPVTFEKVYEIPVWFKDTLTGEIMNISGKWGDDKVFASQNGQSVILNINDLPGSGIAPKLALKELVVNDILNEDIWYSTDNVSFTVSHDENNVQFGIAPLHYSDASRNMYSFYLEGFDEDWREGTLSNRVGYYKLSPGKYSLIAKASNDNGVWTEPIILASFQINHPWWANPIAYLFYSVVVGLVGYRFYKVRVNIEVAEAEAKRLKDVDEFKSRFFTNISHEFRTPLTVIMGLSDRLKDDSSSIIIKRNASKLLELINQILELSKLEANQSKVKTEQFDFVQYVNYSVQSLESLANERGINLSVETDFDSINVELDKQKTDLILHNLVSNALKFTNRGGNVTVYISKGDNSLSFSVSDTGVGIDKESLNQIFNRFFQSDLDNHRYEGTGIGLALTNELVVLLNGVITVESKVGIGSTFNVTLPCTFVEGELFAELNQQKEGKSVKISTSSEDAELILLVEDNNDVRKFIKEILQEYYRVEVAHNGLEGVEKATEFVPDIIVTDVMMPFKDGFELTEDLKQNEKTSHIPIVMLTAKADVQTRISGLKTGADIYLGKPFNEEELKTHIQNLLYLRNTIRKRYSGDISSQILGDSIEDEFVMKIHSSVLDNLDDSAFGIDEVCKAVGTSRTQLYRKIKAITGKSSAIFIRDIRLHEARKMLRVTTFSISEIAYSVGFNDPNYFTKLYSEKFNHSPRKEREIGV